MDHKFSSNNNENKELSIDDENSDYKNLITRLKTISITIALLEKQNLEKF